MKRVLVAAGVVAAILAATGLSLPYFVNANQFRPRLESTLNSALGRRVTMGDLHLSLFPGSLKTQDFAIADEPRFDGEPFFRAKSLALGVNLWQLITTRKVTVTDLTIDDAEISMIQNPAGEWNFIPAPPIGPIPGGKEPAAVGSKEPDFLVTRMDINNARLTVTRQGGGAQKPLVFENVNIAVKQFAPEGGFPFSVTGKLEPAGEIKIDGKVGQISPADASLTPVEVTLKISGVDLTATGLTASEGVSGVIAIDGSGSITGKTVDAKGQIHIDKAKFVRQGTAAKQPVEFDFAVKHDLHAKSGVLKEGALRLGGASVSVTGNYAESGDVVRANLRVAGPGLAVNTATGLLPALGVQLPAGSSLEGGTASVNMAVTGPVTDPSLAGSVGLSDTKLKGYDLGAKLGAIERLAGIHPSADTLIQALSAKVRSGPGGTAIQELKLVAPAIGELDGAGTISARRELDLKMRATLHGDGVVQLALGSSVPFFVRGSLTNPLIVPDVTGIAASEARRPVQVLNGIGGLFGAGKKKQ